MATQFRIGLSKVLIEASSMSDTVNQFEVSQIDPRICPICQQRNACLNILTEGDHVSSKGEKQLACGADNASCWCQSSDVTFPVELLQRIPSELIGKACICATCYQAAIQDQEAKQEKRND